jgi:TonB family protein
MAVSLLAQLLASALLTSSAAAQDSSAAAAPPPAPTCASPIYDAKHDCRVIASGSAKLQCTVMADGSLQNCSVMSEDPPGKGFGEAALASAKTAHVRADASRPAEGVIVKNIPFTFKPDQD